MIRILLVLALVIFTTTARAEVVRSPVGEPCSELFNYQSVVYTCLDHPTRGKEVHVINGGRFDTQTLLDIDPGPGDSSPRGFFELSGDLYFFAENTALGDSLWRSDGTASGTKQVVSIAQRFGYTSKRIVASFGGYVYFEARRTDLDEPDPDRPFLALFQTDGTASGTRLIDVPITAGLGSSLTFIAATSYQQFNGALYLVTLNSLYRVNSTGVASVVAADLGFESDPDSASAQLIGELFDGRLVIDGFAVIWLSDGTSRGTRLFKGGDQLIVGSPTVVNDRMIYVDHTNNSLRATNGESDIVVAEFRSETGSLAILQHESVSDRAVYSQPFIANPVTFFSGGSINTTRRVFADTSAGKANFAGSFYAFKQSPTRFTRFDPITGQEEFSADVNVLSYIVGAVPQGVTYVACIDNPCLNSSNQGRLGIWLSGADNSQTLLTRIGTLSGAIDSSESVERVHSEGGRSYFHIDGGVRGKQSPFEGLWHTNGTSGSTYRLMFQFENGLPPGGDFGPVLPTILQLLLDEERESPQSTQ